MLRGAQSRRSDAVQFGKNVFIRRRSRPLFGGGVLLGPALLRGQKLDHGHGPKIGGPKPDQPDR